VSQCGKREPVVARIGSEQIITQSAFRAQVLKLESLNFAEKASLAELKQSLDPMINQKLRVIAAGEMHLDKDSSVVFEYEQEKERLLLERLYEKEILDKAVKESEIREFYAKSSKEATIGDIYIAVSPGAKPSQIDSIKAIAEGIANRIRAGADFQAMARQYSNDQQSQFKDGGVGSIKWTRSDDPIQQAVFSMKADQVSDPIRNKMGFHIIRVEEINTVPQTPYNQARDNIKKELLKEHQAETRQSAQRYWEDLKTKENVQWKDAAIDSLVRRVRHWAGKAAPVILDSLAVSEAGFKSLPLVVFQDGAIDVAAFIRSFKEQARLNPRIPLDRPAVLKSVLERQMMGKLLAKMAIKKKLDRDSEYLAQAQASLENILQRLVYDQEINSKSQPNDAQIRAYYEAHRDSFSVTDEKVRIQEILVKSPDLARQVLQWANQGKDFGALAAQYTIRPGFKAKKGDFGLIPKNQLGTLSKPAEGLGKGQIVGPIELPNDQGYSIIKMLDRTQTQVQTFEYIKPNVRRQLTLKMIKETETQWLAGMKEKYPVHIDEKLLINTFKQKD
jgi:parvulin-like peptidyl-prolyl isomerase